MSRAWVGRRIADYEGCTDTMEGKLRAKKERSTTPVCPNRGVKTGGIHPNNSWKRKCLPHCNTGVFNHIFPVDLSMKIKTDYRSADGFVKYNGLRL